MVTRRWLEVNPMAFVGEAPGRGKRLAKKATWLWFAGLQLGGSAGVRCQLPESTAQTARASQAESQASPATTATTNFHGVDVVARKSAGAAKKPMRPTM